MGSPCLYGCTQNWDCLHEVYNVPRLQNYQKIRGPFPLFNRKKATTPGRLNSRKVFYCLNIIDQTLDILYPLQYGLVIALLILICLLREIASSVLPQKPDEVVDDLHRFFLHQNFPSWRIDSSTDRPPAGRGRRLVIPTLVLMMLMLVSQSLSLAGVFRGRAHGDPDDQNRSPQLVKVAGELHDACLADNHSHSRIDLPPVAETDIPRFAGLVEAGITVANLLGLVRVTVFDRHDQANLRRKINVIKDDPDLSQEQSPHLAILSLVSMVPPATMREVSMLPSIVSCGPMVKIPGTLNGAPEMGMSRIVLHLSYKALATASRIVTSVIPPLF